MLDWHDAGVNEPESQDWRGGAFATTSTLPPPVAQAPATNSQEFDPFAEGSANVVSSGGGAASAAAGGGGGLFGLLDSSDATPPLPLPLPAPLSQSSVSVRSGSGSVGINVSPPGSPRAVTASGSFGSDPFAADPFATDPFVVDPFGGSGPASSAPGTATAELDFFLSAAQPQPQPQPQMAGLGAGGANFAGSFSRPASSAVGGSMNFGSSGGSNFSQQAPVAPGHRGAAMGAIIMPGLFDASQSSGTASALPSMSMRPPATSSSSKGGTSAFDRLLS